METNESKETTAILAMGEKLATYEAEIVRLTTRVQELETIVTNQRAMIKELQQSSLLLLLLGKEMKCNPHPNAPHGFLRQASHSAGRYVCECEWWDEKDYELATLEEAEEFDKKRNYEWDQWKAIK